MIFSILKNKWIKNIFLTSGKIPRKECDSPDSIKKRQDFRAQIIQIKKCV